MKPFLLFISISLFPAALLAADAEKLAISGVAQMYWANGSPNNGWNGGGTVQANLFDGNYRSGVHFPYDGKGGDNMYMEFNLGSLLSGGYYVTQFKVWQAAAHQYSLYYLEAGASQYQPVAGAVGVSYAGTDGAAYAVRAACFALRRTEELHRVAGQTAESYRQHRDQTKDRFDVGAAMNYEVSKAEVDYQNALLAEISASNAVETARASLALALGLAENPRIALGDCSFPEMTNDVGSLMAVAATNAPALAALRASADAAKDYVDWTICDLYPKLSFSLTFDAKGESSPLLWNYAAVPAVAQNLFSAGAKNRQIEAAVAQLRAARSKLAEAEQKLYNQVLVATLSADRARKSLAVAETALAAAHENFDVVSSRYDVGKASALERTDAQVALSSAEAAVVTARYDLLDTQILLARLIGE